MASPLLLESTDFPLERTRQSSVASAGVSPRSIIDIRRAVVVHHQDSHAVRYLDDVRDGA